MERASRCFNRLVNNEMHHIFGAPSLSLTSCVVKTTTQRTLTKIAFMPMSLSGKNFLLKSVPFTEQQDTVSIWCRLLLQLDFSSLISTSNIHITHFLSSSLLHYYLITYHQLATCFLASTTYCTIVGWQPKTKKSPGFCFLIDSSLVMYILSCVGPSLGVRFCFVSTITRV